MAARSAAPLRAVDANSVCDPEAELAALFAQEAQLARQLADVRRFIESARRRYGEREGFLVLPSYDGLRARLAPQVQP